MESEKSERTQPKPRGIDLEPTDLVAKRYGTDDMCRIWGAERTFEYSLDAQADSIKLLADWHPDVVPRSNADELIRAATLDVISPDRIRKLEASGGHDVIAINKAWGEKVSPEAGAHINETRTSADTTETAKGRQLQDSLIVIADSIENLRDITLERAIEWIDMPHMDTTHLLDAMPTILGRPFAFYAEMLQSNLDLISFVYANSLMGKWADASGNHHGAASMNIDGRKLEEEYCKRLGLRHMKAPAQIPGREYLADVIYSLTRAAHSVGNLARFIRQHRGSDVGVFKFPLGKKGSTSMPHKDASGGNPDIEEQAGNYAHYMTGNLTTQASTIMFDYARNLEGSASDRINLEESFKFGDNVIRRMSDVAYRLIPVPERAKERVERSYGTITSPRVLAYLTDHRRTERPMTRDQAHDLLGALSTVAYESRRQFRDVLLESEDVTTRLPAEVIREISDPVGFIGYSKDIVRDAYTSFHKKKTFSN